MPVLRLLCVWHEPDARPLAVEPPVRRQRPQATTVRTTDRAGPEPIRGHTVGERLRWEEWCEALVATVYELACELVKPFVQRLTVAAGEFHCCFEDQPSDWVQVIRNGVQAEACGLERYAPATRRRIQNTSPFIVSQQTGLLCQPLTFLVRCRIGERPLVAVSLALEPLTRSFGLVDPATRGHRVPMNPQHVQELRPVRIRRQQACQDCRPAGHEGASRPPDMKTIRGWKRRHRRPLAQALDADLGDRQPLLDQPSGPSWFGLFHHRPGSSSNNEDDKPKSHTPLGDR